MPEKTMDSRGLLQALAAMEDRVEEILEMRETNREASGLDPKSFALVKIAGLVTLNAALPSYVWQVGMAREAGVTEDEVAGVLVALAPTIGMARAVAAAPAVAAALGVEVETEAE